ncbi:ferrous iron transport protein B [Stetteria hydrogenophila]
MRTLKIALVGQPNVGKSSLINALVGPRVIVSNYPGTTVEITMAEKTVGDTKIVFVDTPGIYSISDNSEEEKVTERVLFEEGVDGVVVVADASFLERSLYTALQILEAEIPVIIALNFVEEAEKKGIRVNYKKLEEILNVPVIPINPITKKGINKLVDAVLKIKDRQKPKFKIKYDDHIEKAIHRIAEHATGRLPKRFIAVRCLEGDEDFCKYLNDKKVIEQVRKELEKYHPEVAKDIAITRYGLASLIAGKVIELIPIERSARKAGRLEERVDRILLHESLGPVITGLFFLAIFGTLLYLGNFIQGVFTDLTDRFLSRLTVEENTVASVVLDSTLSGLAAGIAVALPYVFLFYLLLGLLEDVGLLPRFIVNVERFLRKLGLPGKAFIPLALGLGCSVPATRATRVLSSKKEQLYTASLLAFVPCSSRTAIIMGIAGFYGGVKLAFLAYMTLLAAGLIWAFALKRILHVEAKPLLLELPPYRRPLIRNVLAKSWIRMKDFVYIVIPLLILGGMIYGILDAIGATTTVLKPLSPVAAWLGLPAVTLISLVFGFLQKDLTIGMLVSALGSDLSSALTPLQLYTFSVAAITGVPCMNAMGMLIKEFGFKKGVTLTVTTIAYGLLLAGLIWRIASHILSG